MPTQTFFNQLLIFKNLYQHLKNQAIFCSGQIVDLKVLQPDWLKVLQSDWLISQELALPSNTTNNINFHYGTNSEKLNDQISINPKNLFWPIFSPFPPFLEQNVFFPKVLLTLCLILAKSNHLIPDTYPD